MGRKKVHANDAARQEAHRRKRGAQPRDTYIKQHDDSNRDAWLSRAFIAIDGEGEDDANGTHHYTMLTASDGSNSHSIESTSLSTDECIVFLLNLKKQYPNGIFCGFSFNYDINMMLCDVPLEALQRLRKGACIYKEYLISWIPSKMFRISWYPNKDFKQKPKTTITIYDVFGFFQASFVKVLKEWKVGTKEQVHTILQMKKQRGNFAEVDNSTINEYNTLECVLLVELMNKLRLALDTVDLRLTSWHGAGAVGGAFLKKNGIDKYIADVPEDVQNAIMHAYFGGRFQTIMLGEHKNAHSHDIRSAYPSAFTELPSMHGEWKEVKEYDEKEKYSLWYIRWEYPNAIIGTFPHRYKRRISYPTSGEGFYWYPEVQAAIKTYGSAIKVLRGYVFTPYHDDKPFLFLNTAYEQRAKFKKEKNDAQQVLKLGINSVYGKTAQGTIGTVKPKFQSYFWAGYCTSLTRARIFELAMRKPNSVIAFATDGVFATERLTTDDEEINELGNWEHGDNFYLFWAQSGVYFAYDYETQKSMREHVNRKTRGLGKNEVSFAKLRKQWRNPKTRHSASDTVSIRRFFGLQYCLHTNRMDLWRKWSTITKTLELAPNKNYIAKQETKKWVRFGQVGYPGIMSEPYVEKGGNGEDETELLEYYMDTTQPEFEL